MGRSPRKKDDKKDDEKKPAATAPVRRTRSGASTESPPAQPVGGGVIEVSVPDSSGVSVGGGAAVAAPVASLFARSPLKMQPASAKHSSPIRKPTKKSLLSAIEFDNAKETKKEAEIRKRAFSKCVIARGPAASSCFLIFRVQPDATEWPEKVLSDLMRHAPAWVVAFDFERRFVRWHHEGEEQKNSRGYSVRMFAMPCREIPTRPAMKELGQEICNNVNTEPGNTTSLEVDPDSFFWHDDIVTWQFIASTDDCIQRIFNAVGRPDGPAWWEKNAGAVKYCFAPGSMSDDLARMFFAPQSMVTGVVGNVGEDNQVQNQVNVDVMQIDNQDEVPTDDELEEDGEEHEELPDEALNEVMDAAEQPDSIDDEQDSDEDV